MRELVAVAMQGQPFVHRMLRAWDEGDAVLPVDTRLPAPARQQLLDAMRPSRVVDEAGEEHRLDDGVPVEDGDALVMATSGSTGSPKGVVHTHDSVAASARATSRGLGVRVDDSWVCCLPLAHVAGLSVVTRAMWAGLPVEVLPTFDSAELEAAARDRGATLTTVVPTALLRIDPSLFRRIVVGGTAPPDELPDNCVVSYGMTETGSAVAYDGRALESVELRIVDREIQVRGPMLFRSYRDGRDPKSPEGWFATGDAGEIDDDGRLVVHGRQGDLIITGGENVWPTAVENVLARHPAVAEVAVVGRPDDDWGQRVVAIVVPVEGEEPPALDELRDHVKQELHPFAAPRDLVIRERLPRTPLGKVERKALE